jgi:hypothetical protein
MIEIFKKELRALRPMAWLIVGFWAATFAYDLYTQFPDIPEEHASQSEATGALVLIGLFATMTGASLLVGESEEGTLAFLDALPVSRTRLFAVKIVAGLLVLELLPLLGLASDAFTLAAMHDSTSPPFPWAAKLAEVGQESVVTLYLLSLAALLSFARKWFALLMGFILWGFLWLRVQNVEWSALFDPLALLTPIEPGAPVRIPWRPVEAELGFSAAALALAWLGFHGLGDRLAHAADRAGRSWLAGAARLAGLALIPVVWIGVFYSLFRLSGGAGALPSDSSLGDNAFGAKQTLRYDFAYRASNPSQIAKAISLIAKADGIHDTVTKFLGAAPVPGRIVVDLASPVIEHTLGLTNWTKIRMPLQLEMAVPSPEAILGHETTHVYIEQLSDGAMGRHFDSTRFFHEGLATYVEHRYFSTTPERLATRRLAALAQSRGRISFATLASNEALVKERDAGLVYPFGEVFCEALVATHGEAAPGQLIRAFARPGAPADLKGAELWRDAMQSCGYDLDRVTAAYDAILSAAMKSEAAFIAKFPRLTGRVEVVGDEIVIHPTYEGAAPGEILCQLEPGLQMTILHRAKDGAFHLARNRNPGRTLRYALGWDSRELRLPLFEPFTNVSLD